jgi:hypothetical protein
MFYHVLTTSYPIRTTENLRHRLRLIEVVVRLVTTFKSKLICKSVEFLVLRAFLFYPKL